MLLVKVVRRFTSASEKAFSFSRLCRLTTPVTASPTIIGTNITIDRTNPLAPVISATSQDSFAYTNTIKAEIEEEINVVITELEIMGDAKKY